MAMLSHNLNELAQTTHNGRAQLTRDGQQKANDIIDKAQ